MKKLYFSLLFLSLISIGADDFSGKVISVHDGDTIRVLDGKQQKKVRLFGIDAPEANQDFGSVSRDFLKSKIHKQNVKIEFKENDQYGRIVGVVFLNGENMNLRMVKEGYAWVYRSFNKSKEFISAEEEAQKKGIGLWASKNPTPPWEFRKNEKSKKGY